MNEEDLKSSGLPVLEDATKGTGTWFMLIMFMAAVFTLVHSGSLSVRQLVYALIIGAIVTLFDTLRYWKQNPIPEGATKLVALIGYHLALLAFYALVAGIGYPFIFVGLILVFLSHIWYGERGALLSILGQVIGLSFVYIVTIDEPDYKTFAYFFSVAVVLVYLSRFLSEIVQVADRKISELQAKTNEVVLEHTKINSLINSMGDGVIVMDANGKIVNYNGAALQLVDTNESIGGKMLADFLDLKSTEGHKVDVVQDAKEQRRTINRDDLVLTVGKDDKINIYSNISPIIVGYGKDSVKGYTLLLRDITHQKSLEEERDEFISVVSHELRTPIAITEGKISNAILTNDNGKKDKKIKASLKDAHDQTTFLASMINDLSTLARAERGTLDMEITTINPSELMQEIKANYQAQAEKKGLKLEVHASKGLPAIENSKLYIQEILQNFVTNSIKYTKEGKVEIQAKKGKKKGTVAFSVKDTGIGISTSDKKHLFEKFFRSEDYRTRESSGTGLGLHVTKKLTAKVGGEIDVKSKLNNGSTFTLTVGSI